MIKVTRTFPKNFLWGASTASYQVEGGIENCDWAEEARKGKVPSAGKACDQYHLYDQDFKLARSLGHNAHKISIEWARIEPEEGKWNLEEIEHYKKVLDSIRANNMLPFVTLWHFTLPLWISKRGGFKHHHTARAFAKYCAFVVEKLNAPDITWVTMNEPVVFASNGYIRGGWPPFVKGSVLKFNKVFWNLVHGHNHAYKAIKRVAPNAQVGIAKNNFYVHSDSNPFNIICKKLFKWAWNDRFLKAINNHNDFISVHYYFHNKFGKPDRQYVKNDMGWDICPEGLEYMLVDLKKYNKPVYVGENGLDDRDDSRRSTFLHDHIEAIHRALERGVDIRGYFHWSLLDNFEWAWGYGPKFGLVKVNLETQERTPKASALFYKKIIEDNSI